METVKKILAFLNVLDDNGDLSITNIGLIALITKVTVASNVDWPSVVAIIAAFSNYAHKRAVVSKSEDTSAGQ